MTLDSEDQKKFLLEALKQLNVPWHLVELAAEVKKAIESAEVK